MLLNAILPIFLLILFGYCLKYLDIVENSFWEHAERLTYYIFFPALLISKMSTANLAEINIWPTAIPAILSLLLISTISFAVKPLLKINNSSFGSVYQGSIRFNTYIGLALVDNLFGLNGLVIAVIIASIMIPTVNICAVTVLQYHHPQRRTSADNPLINIAKQVINITKALLRNPLIIGCLVGIGINIAKTPIPSSLLETIRIIGSIALPLGLMSVGAAFLLTNIKSSIRAIAASSILKLIIYPFIAFSMANLFQLEIETKQILTIFCALPTATARYVLAKNFQSDHQLMARIITLETLFSGLTLLLLLKLLNIG